MESCLVRQYCSVRFSFDSLREIYLSISCLILFMAIGEIYSKIKKTRGKHLSSSERCFCFVMQRYLRKNSDCNLIPNSWYALRVIKLGADDLAYKLWKELAWASKIMQQWVLTIFAFIESLEYALWHSKLLKYFNCCSFKNLVWTWNQDFLKLVNA